MNIPETCIHNQDKDQMYYSYLTSNSIQVSGALGSESATTEVHRGMGGEDG